MTSQAARRFVQRHGVVLESARGPVPNLAEAVARAPIRGSWWAHEKGHEIFALTRAVRGWRDVLVCRLVGRKITYVHRRLWPALVRLAPFIEPDRLAALHELHTSSGRHVLRVVAYPRWVPPDARKAARWLTEEDAARLLETISPAIVKALRR
jgi:hypothetical protein